MRRALAVHRLGRIPYEEAMALQQQVAEARHEELLGDTLLVLEHPRTVTLGRGASADDLLLPRELMQEAGIAVVDVGRGGGVTYHGPGQVVGYPIIDLKPDRMDVRKYVRSLEDTMIQTCRHYGIDAGTSAEGTAKYIGAWVEPHGHSPRKIGAVGVRLSRWITMHGFALNVDPLMADFTRIVPCGIRDRGVTSLALELEEAPSFDEVMGVAIASFAELHGYDVSEFDGPPEL